MAVNLRGKESDGFLAAGTQAVQLASRYLLDHWGMSRGVVQKESHHSIVSAEDLRSEEIILGFLEKEFPGHSFLSEERGQVQRHSEFTWIVDPLDGSSYYVRGLRSFSISLALLHEGQPIVGIVACPSDAEFFTAVKAGGAYLNGRRVTVSSQEKLQDGILSFSHSFLRAPQYAGPRNDLVPSCRSIRGGGSCAQELCCLACGRTDGFIAPSQSLWDFAAGAILIEEAGGRLTDFAGQAPCYSALRCKDFPVVASNGLVHGRIVASLAGCISS